MIFSQHLYRDLSPLLPENRLYPEFLPLNVPLPAAVYLRVSGISEGTVCADGETARYYITIYGVVLSDAVQLARRVQQRLRETTDYVAEQDNAPDFDYLPEMKAHYVRLDYLVSAIE